MTIFKVDRDVDLRLQKKFRRILTIPTTLIVFLFLVVICYTLYIRWAELSLILTLVLIYVLISMYIINKYFAREQESYLTTEIELGDDYIVYRYIFTCIFAFEEWFGGRVRREKGIGKVRGTI